MKQIKYVLFLFLFLVISCKTKMNNLETGSKPTAEPKMVSLDFDNDGVPDNYDKCPDIKGSVNNMGCPDIEVSENYSGTKDDIIVKSPKDSVTAIEKKPIRKSGKKSVKKEEVVIQDPQYTQGLIAYKVPKNMTVGNSYLVKIRITKENNKTMLVVGDRKIPIADDVDNSVVEVEDINVSPIMSANLIVGKNSFRIDTLSTEYQNISKRGYTEWAWNIIPLKGGNNLLKLNVKIRIKEDGESYYKDIVVFDKKINIKSNIKFSIITWISEYWQWLLVTILIPLIKWLYDEWKKRKEENKNKV